MSNTQTETMKAVHYAGPFKVTVKEIPLPKIQHPDDVIIKVTTGESLPTSRTPTNPISLI